MLYHYTTLDGFRSIIESQSVWCSDVRYLNDYEEVEHGKRWLRTTHDVLRSSSSRSNRFRQLSSVAAKLETTEITAFACSFCAVPDLLSQWRGYGGSVGVSIGFDDAVLENSVSLKISPVLYEDDQLINAFSDVFYKGLQGKNTKDVLSKLERDLTLLIFSAKNSAFSEEKESRIILTVDAANNHKKIKNHKVLYRSRGSILIPYVEIDLTERWQELLREVWVGPSSHRELVWKSVKEFLSYNKLRSVEVSQSATPYRA